MRRRIARAVAGLFVALGVVGVTAHSAGADVIVLERGTLQVCGRLVQPGNDVVFIVSEC